MNVCFLVRDFNVGRGLERVVSMMSSELASMADNVSVLSLTQGLTPYFPISDEVSVASLYPHLNRVSFKRQFFSVVWKLRSYIKKNRIDVLVVADSAICRYSIPSILGLEVKHICWEHFNFKARASATRRHLGRVLAAKYGDYVVTLTTKDKEYWEYGISAAKAKIVSIPNPSPYADMSSQPSRDLKRVVSVGSVCEQKGFDLLLQAWALVIETHPDWSLRIVGSGPDTQLIENMAIELGISNSVEFVGHTKNIIPHYEEASFYCMSSRYEGFGMVLVEAQAFGLPIVSFDCDVGPSDIVSNGETGFLCEPEDIQSLAIGIKKIIDMPEDEYSNFSKAAKINALRFELKSVADQWLAILK